MKKIKFTTEQKQYKKFSEIKGISWNDTKISIPHSHNARLYLTSTHDILLKLLEKYSEEELWKIWIDTPRKIMNLFNKNNIDTYLTICSYEPHYSWKKYYGSSPIAWYPHTLYTPAMKFLKKYVKEKLWKVKTKKIIARKKVPIEEIAGKDEKVVEALYVINKEAKKLRDKKLNQIDKIYWEEWSQYYVPRFILNKMHEKLQNLKFDIELIYSLKWEVIDALVEKNILKLEGYHTFDDWEKRDYYTFGTFGFHDNNNISSTDLWSISWIIESEKEFSKMSFKKASEILHFFLNSQNKKHS